MGLGEAVRADCWWKINSETSPIDLDGFRLDPADPKIQKISENPGSTIPHRVQNDNFQ